jgi:Cys-rich repeat protein
MRHAMLPLLALLLASCGSSTALAPVGGACKATADCASGLTCDTDDPGGLCTKPCTADGECGTGNVCSAEKKCYKACATAADCRAAPYACVTDSTAKKFCDKMEATDGGSTD